MENKYPKVQYCGLTIQGPQGLMNIHIDLTEEQLVIIQQASDEEFDWYWEQQQTK